MTYLSFGKRIIENFIFQINQESIACVIYRLISLPLDQY